MISRKEAYKLSETHRNENRAEFFVGEDLNASLFEAIQKRNITKVQDLIDYVMQNHKSIDFKNFKAAISQANPRILELIIPHCGFSKPSDLYIPRELVIKSGEDYENCVKLLLNWNFVVNPDSKEDEEFVYASVEKGYLPIVLQLLDHGIDVNMVNSATGLNLLTIACLLQHHEIIKSLLKHNADVNVIIPSINKRLYENYLLVCCIRSFTEFVLVIFEDQNLCDMTCLHIAVLNSDPITTKLLLKYGAKITNDPKFFIITYLAIANGHEDIFRIFLDYGVNAVDVGPQGKTFLHSFVFSEYDTSDYIYYYPIKDKRIGVENIAKWLLENGADIHLQTPGNSLVFETITKRYPKITQLFLDYNPDVQYINSDGNTALHVAIENNYDLKFIKTLLKLNSPVNIVNDNGLTPLIIACKLRSYDRWEIIKALLHYDVNVNCTDKKLMTPLHFTCDYRNVEFVTLLLEKGANPNAKNNEGETPLHYACKLNSIEAQSIILLLLEHNANIEAMDTKGWTPLFTACCGNNNVTVKLLLHNNANVNCTDKRLMTPLHFACDDSNLEFVTLLLEKGANLNAKNEEGETPLHYACKHGSNKTQSIIKLLLKHDANIEAMDRRGRTPLFTACERNNDVIVKLLLENNAYVNYKDSGNSTSLHIAVKRGCVEATRCLIEYGGANIDIWDNNNQTPLQIVEERLLDSQNYKEGFQSHLHFNRGYDDEDDEYTGFRLDKSREYRLIKTFIVDYADRIKIAELEIKQKIIENNSSFNGNEYETMLKNEIKIMKLKHIGTTGITNKITFYDLLTKNIHFLSRFVKNDIILEALKDKINEMEFPLYIHIVRSRFREAKIRCKLIDSAREYFRKNVYEKLPDDCIDLIFSYLSIDELFIFIGAKIPFNGESFEKCHENSV